MIIKKQHITALRADIYYPLFENNEDGDDTSSKRQRKEDCFVRMNAFFEALRDGILAIASEYCTGEKYLADYTAAEKDGAITVTYTLRKRKLGRITHEKRLSWRWRDGVICKEK